VVSFMPRSLYSCAKSPPDRRLGEPRAGLNAVTRKITSLPLPGIEPRRPVRILVIVLFELPRHENCRYFCCLHMNVLYDFSERHINCGDLRSSIIMLSGESVMKRPCPVLLSEGLTIAILSPVCPCTPHASPLSES
jgi:hypothetical protein